MFEKNVDKTRVVTVRKAFWGVDTLVAVGTKMLNPPVKGGCWFTFNVKINQSMLTVGCCNRQQLIC